MTAMQVRSEPHETRPHVGLRMEGGLATIVLDRPEQNNAIDLTMAEQFAAAVSQVVACPGIRALLIRAEGRNFCVGGDIAIFAEAPGASVGISRLAARLHEVVSSLRSAGFPVVVAVQGAAAGIGLSLAACADIVLAGRSAVFVMAYSAIGLTPDGGATWMLPRLIGLRRTQILALTNRRLSAAEAEDWGLISEVCDDDVLTARAEAMARNLAAGPTSSFGRLKYLLRAADASPLEAHLDRETQEIGCALDRADGVEGVAAYLQRRQAVFPGV